MSEEEDVREQITKTLDYLRRKTAETRDDIIRHERTIAQLREQRLVYLSEQHSYEMALARLTQV